MSVNLSDPIASVAALSQPNRHYKWWMVLGLPLWVFVSFEAAQYIVEGILLGLKFIGVPFAQVNDAILQALISVGVYGCSLLLVIGLPLWLRKQSTTSQELGLNRLPVWMDIFLSPAGFIIYILLSAGLVTLIKTLLPGLINTSQAQSIGFSNLTYGYQYILAFLTLVLLAPVAEETLFRGYLYGKLRKHVPLWAAILATSLLFAALHLPGGGPHLQWDVAFDVFALSLVLCGLREVTGNIYAGMLLHMIKNGLAFYLLFVNPALSSTIGR